MRTRRPDDRTVEEVVQTEVENLADEIAQAEEEGIDPLHLESLESGIEASAEALVSMGEARVRLPSALAPSKAERKANRESRP